MRFVGWLAAAALFVTAAATATPARERPGLVAGDRVTKLVLRVDGIGCDACAKRLREALTKMAGVVAVDIRERTNLAVDFEATKTSEQAIRAEVVRHGFTVK